MKKKASTWSYKIFFLAEAVVVCVLFLTILYLNFYKLKNNIADTDYIAELNYGRLVWEEKTFFPETWVYGAEYMFFRPAALYALIYGLTGEYLLSASIVLSISLFLIVGSFCYLCRGTSRTNLGILAGIIVLLSLGGIERSFSILTYLFYGYYAYYLLLPN